jgi:pimeloyl-ACP methyl ester carboxylesterase
MAIIFVPGIKGSKLVDTYPTDFKVRWSLEDLVVGNIFEDTLDFELKEGLYDVDDTHLFREWELINYAYERIVERLRKWVTPQLYTFPYDWRKPIDFNAKRLNAFIEHVQGKLKANGKEPTVSFFTHSMGGLVLRSALGLRKPKPFEGIGRIAFISPPFRGSCGIPKVLIAGEKNGWFSNEEDFRKLARSFPSVYQMIPWFKNAAVAAKDGRELNLFEMKNWQQNVVQSKNFRKEFLINAEAFLKGSGAHQGGSSDAPILSDTELRRHANQIAVILSVGYDTCYQIPVETENARNKNWFDFKNQRQDENGDQRVHLKSAAIQGITLAAYEGAASHGVVCRDSKIIKSVSRWLEGKKLLKMKARTPRHSIKRRSKTYFEPWDGKESSFHKHIVKV